MTKVLVVYTGGTIGMVHEEPSNEASPLVPVQDAADLVDQVPQLQSLGGISFDMVGLVDDTGRPVEALDSSDVNAAHWTYMAEAVERSYSDYDGFVILHGTDTMAYTASALSFMLANLAKPVVVTGSQLPMFETRTDAVQNFANALYIAGYRTSGLPCVPEVTVCFADTLLRGNRVRKMSTSAWQGFATPNYPVLGDIGEHIRIHTERVWPGANNETAPFYARTRLDRRVLDFGLFPGLDPEALASVLSLEPVRGVVLRTFGAGNAPGDPKFLEVISAAIAAGKMIVNVTQCPQGQVEAGLYAASSGLLERGVISGLDMTPEAALTKLMWLLGEELEGNEVQTQMQIDQRGEQTESLFSVDYSGTDGVRQGTDGTVTVGARPSGHFTKSTLQRAILRIRALGVEGTSGSASVRAFFNLPSANQATEVTVPHYAADFTLEAGRADSHVLADVTSTVRKVVEEGRAINVTLVPQNGDRVYFERMFLSLFTRS